MRGTIVCIKCLVFAVVGCGVCVESKEDLFFFFFFWFVNGWFDYYFVVSASSRRHDLYVL